MTRRENTNNPQVLVDRTLPPFSCKQHFATLYVSLDPVIHDVQEKGGRVLSTSTCEITLINILS